MKINIFSFLTFFCVVTLIGICGSEAFGQEINLARNPGVTAKQSSINKYELKDDKGVITKIVDAGPASRAIDGDTKGTFWEGGIVETKDGNDGWFEVDLQKFYKINKIVIHPRTDCCRQNMFNSTYVIVTDQPIGDSAMVDDARISLTSTFSTYIKPLYVADNDKTTREVNINGSIGRYIRLQIKGWGAIELTEIEIFGDPKEVAGYTPNPNKSWTADLNLAFDPNFPDVFALKSTDAGFDHFNSLQTPPRIIGVKNPNSDVKDPNSISFDLAFQLLGKSTIRINNYVKEGTTFKKTTNSKSLDGLGIFGGFTKDAAGNRYVFTGAFSKLLKYKDAKGNDVTDWTQEPAKVYKNEVFFWDAKFANRKEIGDVRAMMHVGESRLVVGKDTTGKESLLIASNFAPAHPYQVVLDLQTPANNTGRAFYESFYQHNLGQRAIFDGSDFVVMENRDHDVSVTLSKIKPGEKFPLKYSDKTDADVAKMSNADKENMHANMFTERIFSVYSHTNFVNNTYLELGNVQRGLNDDKGYLVLFAGERDWNYKMDGYWGDGFKLPDGKDKPNYLAPNVLSPRDIGLVHVKKNFDKNDADPTKQRPVNWLNSKGEKTQCPKTVDNSNIVNSIGSSKTIAYKTDSDGWDWYNYARPCWDAKEAKELTERTLVTSGVNWITNFGASYTKKAAPNTEFTSVNHPKLVRIAPNKYVVIWEEWKADYTIYENNGKKWEFGRPKKEYLTTKAVLITLSPSGDSVNIQSSAIKDLGKIRLMPGDDAFEFDGKAAWAVGDVTKGKLMFYTVDAKLDLATFELEV